MIPSLDDLKVLLPDLDGRLASEHLSRLDPRYFDGFSTEEVAEHVRALARLGAGRPVELLTRTGEEGAFECTVLAFDYPGVFSLITGVFAALGFETASGDIFTYHRAPEGRAAKGQESPGRRRIIDRFTGKLVGGRTPDAWAAEAGACLAEVVGMLESGQENGPALARQRVNEMVAASLAERRVDASSALMPVAVEVDNDTPGVTRMKVVSEDTPFFLYTFSAALALRGVSIERVVIRTVGQRIEDEFYIVDAQGGAILDVARIDQVKLSALLTKQFTYFLTQAPDPYAALCRFEQLVGAMMAAPEKGGWAGQLSNPLVMKDLARLLGASDFLWEDFIRLQYESLLPLMGPRLEGRRFGEPPETLDARLDKALEGAATLEEQRQRLNAFKDHEIFLIDLDHILTPGTDFRALSARLTALAEKVVDRAASLVRAALARRFGAPRTVAGLEAAFCVLGLGKFGGAALGYASDIELLFVYSDNGQTGGPERIENREFYERVAQETALFIEAKREGIFQVDLRLRPYGQSGPKACSLETFCRYYGPGGKAMSYERLALVRLRAVGGDAELGARVERLRDELLYGGAALDLEELRDLRERQIREKTEAGRPNAKFSPGALVDLEYAVQIMQVAKGREFPTLRTPRIHEALAALSDAGVLERGEAESLAQAYDFLRRLINGLRMLRGSAKDLFLPPPDSAEYAHLARRMGYEREEGLSPAQKLHMDFDTRTASVRAFRERHFGRGATAGPEGGNVADLALTDQAPDSLKQKILTQAGFRNWKRAYVNLRSLARLEGGREEFARLAVLACDILRRRPDPDMALNNWERFAQTLTSPSAHFQRLMAQPMRLEILMDIFSGSQFLSDTLARNPEFLDWLTVAGRLRQVRQKSEMEADLRAGALAERGEWRNHLRRLRRREALRIGTRDICLGMPMQEIVGEISALAEAAVSVALERLWVAMEEEGARLRPMGELRDRFCVVALGKLGGGELNYSSDIDLVGVYDDSGLESGPALAEFYSRVTEQLRADLSQHTDEGYAYRVDLRLRPYGSAGLLVWGLGAMTAYYERDAALWELQALLKARPIAGSARLGEAFLAAARPLLLGASRRGSVVASIERMRAEHLRTQGRGGKDVKTGVGGLRDVEFLVQGLQLARALERPELLEGNTLRALKALVHAGALPADVGDDLREDYVFLRRVEHCLQIFEDRQVHALPEDAEEVAALARRMMGVDATADAFQSRLAAVSARVRGNYERFLLGKG